MSFFNINNRSCFRWVRKTNYILPPVLMDIVMLYAEGDPDMKRKLKNLHDELTSIHMVHMYTILHDAPRPRIFVSREYIEDVYDWILDDMYAAKDNDNWYAYDNLDDIWEQVNRYAIKIIIHKPHQLVKWASGPFLN